MLHIKDFKQCLIVSMVKFSVKRCLLNIFLNSLLYQHIETARDKIVSFKFSNLTLGQRAFWFHKKKTKHC